MKKNKDTNDKSSWELIFTQSPVNGAAYIGEHLPRWPVQWPRDTWLQRKLAEKTKKTGGSNVPTN